MKFPLFLLLCGALAAPAADYALPAANQGTWTPGGTVGVIGGIDQFRVGGASARTNLIDVSAAPYNADKTGVTACQSAIQAALDAAGANDVIYLPAGTYKLTSYIYIEAADSNKTFRGDGDATVIYGSTANSLFSFAGGGYASREEAQTITGTKTKGATALAITDASIYPVGTLCTVLVENEEDGTRILAGAPPTWSNSGFRDIRSVLSRVTASNTTTDVITVHPPLPWDCTAYATRVEKGSLDVRIYRMGFEDFKVTYDAANHPPFAISMDHGVECWAYNITMPEWKKSTSSGSVINMDYSHRCEVRRCDFRTLAPGTYSDDGAIQLLNSSCILIEDNIAVGWDSGLYNSGKTYNCLVAYNYFDCDIGAYPGHNGHNSMDLYEGNVMPSFQLDGYHGSGSHMSFYRNWLYNAGPYLNRFMYYIAMAGNVYGKDGVTTGSPSYGNPNIGNSGYTGAANHFTGDPHADWLIPGALTTRTSDTTGTITAVGGDFDASDGGTGRYITLFWSGGARYQMPMDSRAGQVLTVSAGFGDVLPTAGTAITKMFVFAQGYQELDNGVAYTASRTENYVSSAGGTGSLEYATADTLPDSLAHSSKPAYFGVLAWPPVDPNSVGGLSVESIPAGYRFVNDAAPAPDSTAPTLTTATIPTGGTTLVLVHNESVVVGAGGNGGWAVTLSTGSATATYASGSGSTTLTYTLSGTVNGGTTGTVAYTQPGSGIEDNAGNDLATLSGVSITNNSTQGGGGGGATITTGSLSVGGTLSIGN